MTWAKVDDHANEHRKQLAAGAEACWLWTCGLMYANRQTARDGFIPEAAVGMLYPFKSAAYAASLALRLVAVGLWEVTDGGYLVHEFEEWNEPKDVREDRKAQARERAAQSYERRRAQNSAPPLRRREAQSLRAEKDVLQNSSGSTPLHSLPERDPPTPSVLPPQGGDIAKADLDSFAPNHRARKPKLPQWRRFPPDFEPDESHQKLAVQLGLNLSQQLAEIRDHEFAKPKSDPAATLRTWLRNAPKFGAPTLGLARAHRPDPRNEAQDRNADHDSREALAASRRVREMLKFADNMKAGATNVR